MKIHWLAAVASILVVSSSQDLDAALIQVGTGTDTSYFVIESPNIGVREYAISYTYDPINDPLGGTDLLDLIAAEDSSISFDILNFGTVSQPNEFLSSITFNGVTETNDFSPGGTTWAQWLAGGQAGAENSSPFAPAPVPLDDDSWTFGSGLSVNYRLVEPGSSDALVFGTGEPSTAPIPEPSSLLLGLGTSLILLRRRR